MAATIEDVAALAGVSIKTVSRVINREPHVRESTRLAVLNAVKTLGYAPNISARRLASQKSDTLCILMYPGFFHNSPGLINVIMDFGYEGNYDILLQPYFPTHTRSRNKLVRLVSEHRIDGFVTTPPCDREDFVSDLLTTFKVPLVQINPFSSSESVPAVYGGDFQGAQMMTRHLIHLGHQRIAFLTGPGNMRSSSERLAGFRATMEKHNLPIQPNWIQDSSFTFDGGFTAAKILLSAGEPKPTAIFSGNDDAAFGALFAAQEMGYSIPRDLSIAGYDDLLISAQVWPGLTTVHQPDEELFKIALQQLIRKIRGESVEPVQSITPYLLIRNTTAAPQRP